MAEPATTTEVVGAATTHVVLSPAAPITDFDPPPHLSGHDEFHAQVMHRPREEWMRLVDEEIRKYRQTKDGVTSDDIVHLKVRLIDHCTAVWKWKRRD